MPAKRTKTREECYICHKTFALLANHIRSCEQRNRNAAHDAGVHRILDGDLGRSTSLCLLPLHHAHMITDHIFQPLLRLHQVVVITLQRKAIDCKQYSVAKVSTTPSLPHHIRVKAYLKYQMS